MNPFSDIKEFILKIWDTKIEYYAASLSFYTIFSIIPLLLVILSILASLPSFQDSYIDIKSFILSNLVPTDLDLFMNYLDSFMENSFKMGIMGVFYILFTSFLFFKNYEFIVSQIFKEDSKNFWNALTTYWTLLTLTPIAILFSFFLSSKIQTLLNSNEITTNINFFAILPYLIIWIIFLFVYKISINTDIRLKSALISSFIASLIWYCAKVLFIYYIFYNKTYSTIYGSFSTVLFFFLWIYLSWLIFLYGIKLCYVLESYNKNENDLSNEDNLNIDSEINSK
jgi:membrane protein